MGTFERIRLPHIDAEIGLLIGNNVPDAYSPLEIRTGPKGSPHAAKSRLGWIMWNVIQEGPTGKITVNRAHVRAVDEELTQLVKQAINVNFPMKNCGSTREYSREDHQFLEKVNSTL